MLLIQDLHFCFPESNESVLAGVSLHLEPGWTGIVGPNGAGKTTLLRLIGGLLVPDAGRLDVPRPVHLCAQHVFGESAPTEVLEFSWDWSGAACRWRGRLELEPEQLERWPTLSPGERRRWQIGAALAAEPAVLLLDEPTNHLDGAGRERLIEALRAFRGVGAVVSHDRALLDTLTSRTAWVEGRDVRMWPVAYGEARGQRERERREARDARDAASSVARKARRELQQSRQRLASAERGANTRARMKGPRDSDARSTAAKGRAAKGVAVQGRAVGRTRAAAERADRALDAHSAVAELGGALFVDYAPPRRRVLFELSAAELLAGDATVLRDVEVQVERGQHVHIAGPNGAGKSTLLRALCEAGTVPEGRLLVLDQDLEPAAVAVLLQTLRSLPRDEARRVHHILAALGVSPPILLATPSPSAGEARKLALALGLGRHAWALVLDEPTNHLDLPSVERLEAMLAAFPGTLLLVTHDPRLADKVCTHRLELRRGTVATVP